MHKFSTLRITAAILVLSISGTASAGTVTISFALQVERKLVGGFPGTDDQAFVPFTSTATMTFDPTYVETNVGGGSGWTNFTSTFAGQNQFTSGLTALLPWGPPFPPGTSTEYDRALFSYNLFDDGSAQNGPFFDKRRYYNDSVAMREYRHAFAVEGYRDTVYPLAASPQDFRTDDLMAYLAMLQAGQLPVRFAEYGLIYDYQAHQYVAGIEYQARAVITSIVPVPAAVWLFASALAALGAVPYAGSGRRR